MPPFELTQSPGAQSYQMPQTGEDEDDIFRDGFRELAYTALGKAMPELVANVLTFVPLDVSAADGRGVGSFVIMNGDETIDVPVVISDNAVKPLDMFYSKRTNMFGPLDPDYLRSVSKGVLSTLGAPSERPENSKLDQPVLSQLPPSTTFGRTVLASDEAGAWLRSVRANDGHREAELAFPSVVSRAPDAVKIACERFFDRHPKIRNRAIEVYGKTVLASMLARTAKTASTREEPVKHDVFLMTASTPIQEAKRELGAETSAAYKAVALNGFYIKDRRKKTDDLFALAERPLEIVEPESAGVYRVYLRKGGAVEALIIPNPIELEACYAAESRKTNRYLIVLKDGRATTVNSILAEAIKPSSVKDIRAFLGSRLIKRPTANKHGFLIATSGLTVRATAPMRASSIAESKAGYYFEGGYGKQVHVDTGRADNRVYHNDTTYHFGSAFEWVATDDQWTNELKATSFYQSQEEVLRAAEAELLKSGGTPVEVKTAGDGFLVGGERRAVRYLDALVKVATRYNVSIPDAEAALKLAQARDPSSLWRVKRAAPAEAPEQDPNAAPMDPAMMAAMAGPPQPSPVDLAVAEQMQVTQNQMAALQEQLRMLQTVQMRTQQIAAGGGAMAAPMGAASMMGGPSMGPGGMPAMAPMGMGGMDPSMMGQMGGMDPSMMGGMGGMQGQPMDPSMMGQMGGMDPSMMGGMQGQMGGMQGQMGGMDPSMMGQPQLPPAPMKTEDLTPENVASQINPAFLDSAASLNDAGAFDAAAIASLAQQTNLRSLTQAYLPTLTRALDNVARILLLFYLHESDIKQQIGGDDYTTTEQRLRDVLEGMGEVIVKIENSSTQLLPMSTQSG